MTPNSINQGTTTTVVIDSTANNFPNANQPYTVTFSQSGVSASVAWTNAHVLTLSVTATSSAATGLGTLTVNGSGGFTAQTAPFTVNASKLNQTITFGALADKRPDQMPLTVSATASSGLAVTFSSGTPAVCTVTGVTVSYVANGTCTVRADQAGNTTYNAAPQVSRSFVIGPANQTITFGALADKVTTDPDFSVSAIASSGLTVVFSSATSAVCTVSGATVHLVTVGTCTINADQAGSTSWNAAPRVTQSFAVTRAPTTTTVSCPAGPYTYTGNPQTPCTATLTVAGLPSTPLGVSHTNNTDAGTANASASFAGSADYLPSSDSKNFNIGKATLTVTPDAKSVTYGDPAPAYTFSVTGFVAGQNAGNAAGYAAPSCTSTYTTSTPVSASPLTITCAGGSADNYTFDTSATAQLTISGATQATLTITAPTTRTYGDAPFAPTTSGGSGSGAVTFDSTTPSVCTASGSATVTIVAAGTCTVTATKAADANYGATTSAPFDITVGKATLTVTPDAKSVTYGDAAPAYTFSVTGFVAGQNAGNAAGYAAPSCTSTYTTSTPVSASPLTITCAGGSADNYTFDTSATAQLTISKADPVCTITGFDGTYDGNAHGAAGSCLGVNDEVLTGLDLGASFTDVPGGTADWTFTDATGNYTDDSGSVDITVGKADPDCTITGFDGTYDATSHGATGSCLGVKGETLAGLNLGALYTNVPGGTADWVFTDGTGNYTDDSGSVDITITKADADCTIDGWTGPYDGNAHGASGSCLGVNGENAGSLDLGASFTDIPGGTADWVFTGNGNYKNQSGNVDIVIEQIEQAITFPSLPNITTSTKTVQLAATTDAGLPVQYTSLTPKVCTVSGSTLTIVGTGTCTIEASQPGDATHAPAEPVRQSFTVASGTTPPTSTGGISGVTGPASSWSLPLLPALAGVIALATLLLFLGLLARARRDRETWG